MVIVTGATGAIGKYVKEYFGAIRWEPRRGGPAPKCDVLINCFGVNHDNFLIDSNYEEWEDTVGTNLLDTMSCIRRVLPYMEDQDYGRIINISSMMSNWAVKGTSAYAASKAGLNAAVRVIAKETARYNVLINNLNLGYMDGGMTHKIPDYHKLKAQIPVKKFGDMSEITSACQFLIDSSYITGSTIDINGGLW